MQLSKRQFEIETQTPLNIENLQLIIVERKSVKKCRCWNSLYETGDPNCIQCSGTGYLEGREQRLSKACLQSVGQFVDEGDPLLYACTHDFNVKVGDVIVCVGTRYIVIEIGAGFTPDNKDVLICGLNYETDNYYDQAELERYK